MAHIQAVFHSRTNDRGRGKSKCSMGMHAQGSRMGVGRWRNSRLLAGKSNCVPFQGVFLFSVLTGKPWFFSGPKNCRKTTNRPLANVSRNTFFFKPIWLGQIIEKDNLECSGKVKHPDRTETNVIIERFSGYRESGNRVRKKWLKPTHR